MFFHSWLFSPGNQNITNVPHVTSLQRVIPTQYHLYGCCWQRRRRRRQRCFRSLSFTTAFLSRNYMVVGFRTQYLSPTSTLDANLDGCWWLQIFLKSHACGSCVTNGCRRSYMQEMIELEVRECRRCRCCSGYFKPAI